MVSYIAEPSESKGDVDPSNLEVSFVPNWMNKLQIPDIMKSIMEINIYEKTRIFTNCYHCNLTWTKKSLAFQFLNMNELEI